MPTTAGLLFPFYIYPTSQALVPLLQAHKSYPSVPMVVILNPNSGPGSTKDSTYVSAVNSLKSAGIKVLGYTATTYGAKSTANVQAEMTKWKQWYSPDGQFFDECDATKTSYYQTIGNYSKSLGMNWIALNPGTYAPPATASFCDNVTIFENSGGPNLSTYAAWQKAGLSSSKATMMLYSQSSIPQTTIKSFLPFVQYWFVTNQGLPNPYGQMPSYFSQLVSFLASTGGGTTGCPCMQAKMGCPCDQGKGCVCCPSAAAVPAEKMEGCYGISE